MAVSCAFLVALIGSGTARAQVPDDDIPGVPLTAGMKNASFDVDDADDVYAIEVGSGRRLTVHVASDSVTMCLFLFPPGSQSIFDDEEVAPGTGCVTEIAYDVPEGIGGTYYLDVFSSKGAGAYTIQTTIGAAGVEATPSPTKAPTQEEEPNARTVADDAAAPAAQAAVEATPGTAGLTTGDPAADGDQAAPVTDREPEAEGDAEGDPGSERTLAAEQAGDETESLLGKPTFWGVIAIGFVVLVLGLGLAWDARRSPDGQGEW